MFQHCPPDHGIHLKENHLVFPKTEESREATFLYMQTMKERNQFEAMGEFYDPADAE
jgi:hypothetical protein